MEWKSTFLWNSNVRRVYVRAVYYLSTQAILIANFCMHYDWLSLSLKIHFCYCVGHEDFVTLDILEWLFCFLGLGEGCVARAREKQVQPFKVTCEIKYIYHMIHMCALWTLNIWIYMQFFSLISLSCKIILWRIVNDLLNNWHFNSLTKLKMVEIFA